jgi:hypothetical protein
VGGIRYAYMYSYTHGVKPNVNPIYITSIDIRLVYLTKCYRLLQYNSNTNHELLQSVTYGNFLVGSLTLGIDTCLTKCITMGVRGLVKLEVKLEERASPQGWPSLIVKL